MSKRTHLLAASLSLLAMESALPEDTFAARPRYGRESKPGKGGKRRTRVINGAEYQRRPKRSR